MSSPPHKLKSTFTSRIFNQTDRRLVRDPLGDFDLNGIEADGTIRVGCFRRPSGKPVTGQAREVEPNPSSHHVEIDYEEETFKVEYRGVAFFDENEQNVTRIAGWLKVRREGALDSSEFLDIRNRLGLLANQDETTWVVTKP